MNGPIALPRIHRERLPSGLQLVVAERPGIPLAAARLVLRGGAALDPERRAGLAHLVALAARRGTRRLSGSGIDLAVESLGADLAAGVDEDATYFGVSAPIEALPRCIEILADVAIAPTFPPAEVQRLRRREIAALAHDLDEPAVIADRAMLQASFGRHPYGHPPEGRVRDLTSVRREDVKAFHSRYFNPGAAILVLVGSVRAETMLALVRRRFGRWRGEVPGGAAIAAPEVPSRAVLIVDKPDVTQTQVRIASAGFSRNSPDFFPGLVASAILGGGFTSRLMEAIRVNRGLSYGVRSRFATSAAGGLFVISTFTKVETTADIVALALEETARFCDAGPSSEELERIQSYLCGLFPLSLETHDQVAEKLAELALFDLPEHEVSHFREHVRAVTTEACQDVGRRYFPLGARVIVAVGPARSISRPLEQFGPVTVVPARKIA